jgi:CRISPR/Cas system endoribonuclease Cas6 (RAMP superfamily)
MRSVEYPAFYTPEAESASTVQCHEGHAVSRRVARAVGRQIYATYGCPYCTWTSEERQLSMRAYEVGFADGKAEAEGQR